MYLGLGFRDVLLAQGKISRNLRACGLILPGVAGDAYIPFFLKAWSLKGHGPTGFA